MLLLVAYARVRTHLDPDRDLARAPVFWAWAALFALPLPTLMAASDLARWRRRRRIKAWLASPEYAAWQARTGPYPAFDQWEREHYG